MIQTRCRRKSDNAHATINLLEGGEWRCDDVSPYRYGVSAVLVLTRSGNGDVFQLKELYRVRRHHIRFLYSNAKYRVHHDDENSLKILFLLATVSPQSDTESIPHSTEYGGEA